MDANQLLAQVRQEYQQLLAQQAQQAGEAYNQLLAKVKDLENARPRVSVDRTVTIDNFDGTGGDIELWLLQVELATKHFTAEQRMDLAEQHFRGAALLWLRQLLSSNEPRPANWDDWKARLVRRFEPVNADERFRERLASLRQSVSLHAYTTEFTSLCLHLPEISARQKTFMYIRGLRDVVREEVQARRPSSFDEAVRLADHFDNIRGRSSSSWSNDGTGTRSSATMGMQMDVGTAEERRQEELD